MAQTSDEKEAAVNAKASKIWRTLRLASRNKLALFEKIDNGKNLDVLFETRDGPEEPAKGITEDEATMETSDPPRKDDDNENLDVPQQPGPDTNPAGSDQQDANSVR